MKFILLLIFTIITITGCTEEKSTEPESKNTFTGITETSQFGPDPIGNIDEDDWKPIDEIGFKIFPAYPNPTDYRFVIRFSLQESATVKIVLDDKPMNIANTITNRKYPEGVSQLYVDALYGSPEQIRNEGIMRVYITVTTEDKEYSTYGDVEYKTDI